LTIMPASALAGAAVAIVITLAATPYLARLTLTVPDRDNAAWWRGARAGRSRQVLTALTAVVVGGLAGAAAGPSALLPAFVALALAGIPLVLIDYEHHRLPNRLVYPAAGAAVALLAGAAAVRDDWPDYVRALEAAAAAYAVLFVLMLISPRSFGWGDVRLGGLLGAYLGYTSWIAVYYGIFGGFVLGSLVSIVLLIMRKATLKTALAFGPMLLLGALLVLAFDISPSLVR
jgi:leader peptidase (prepilin peptidase)/N-methyltransferase